MNWDHTLQRSLPGLWVDARTPAAGLVADTHAALREYGFALVRGLDPDPQHPDRSRVADRLNTFGAALGTIVPQNYQGAMLEDIRDFSDTDAFDNRGYRSPGELSLHTDPPTLIVLHCLAPARDGGENQLVDVGAIHAHMADTRPDLLAALYRGCHYWIPSETEPGAGQVSPWTRPILMLLGARVSCVYYRPYIEMAARAMGAPTAGIDKEAFDYFDATANSAAFQVRLTLAAGDTLVLHNRAVMHARGAYEDWPQAERRRHLLRLWIDAPAIRPAPPEHALGDFFAR